MARTKTTRRTYANKKLQAVGNLKQAESARIEAPLQDVEVSQPQAGGLPIIEQKSDILLDPEPVVSGEIEAQVSPVLGSSQRNANGLTTSTPNILASDIHTASATCVSPSSPCELSLQWDSSMKENSQITANFRPVTPDMSNIPVDEIFSPKTQKELRSTIRALFPNGPPPPPPVKPIRRPKKGDTPYIVGCRSRRRVPSPRSLSVFQGDDYGITDKTNCDEDEQCSPAKRPKRGPRGSGNLSKSRFNPLSDEIAERLKMYEKIDRLLGRTPKEETVGYMTKQSTSRKFSPIPSTSTDSETIMKNDKHFRESFICDNDNYDIDDDDELPEIVWESSKCKREKTDRNDSPLALVKREEKTDFKIETDVNSDYDKSPEATKNDDDDPMVLNEDLNNNDVIDIDDDFCEIDIDKYLPKEKLIITDEEISVKPKIELNDGYSSIAPRVVPTTSSSDIICIDDDFNSTSAITNASDISTNGNASNTSATQDSGNQAMSTVLRASNKISDSEATSDLVIELPDAFAPTVASSQPSANRLPIWNEDVQFVSETKTNEPRPRNNENSENISDVQIVGTSQNVNTARQRSADLLTDLQHFFAFLSESSMASMGRPRKPPKKRTKKQKPVKPSQTMAVNNENTAPTVNQMPAVSVAQPATSDVAGSPPNGKKLGDCPICLDSLTRGCIASTICGHVFCLDCIRKSLSASGKRCPTCRKQLKGAGYHQVFL